MEFLLTKKEKQEKEQEQEQEKEKEKDYEIYFSHQADVRPFNRGAMKNMGFIAMKRKYPDHYKTITFIFHDIDTLPFNRLFAYTTPIGTVTHHYGFETALGGIVVIRGQDFEKVNGYPNFWGWGLEDACIQQRCLAAGLIIDRSNFYPIGAPEILQLFDGVSRQICSRDTIRSQGDNGNDGITSLYYIQFTIESQSTTSADNKYAADTTLENYYYINVKTFAAVVNPANEKFHEYDLRDPVANIMRPTPSMPVSRGSNVESAMKAHWTTISAKPIPKRSGYP